jgi:ribonuclease-3
MTITTPLERRLGVTFDQPELLVRALTHRSFINENPDGNPLDNERLEFLGDAVVGFVVGAHLYRALPHSDEGELTALRAALVRGRSLARFARELEIGTHLRLGYGEAESGGRERVPTLCAAFEAVIGALYLDQGLDAVEQVLKPLIEPALEQVMANSLHHDAKSEFQVWAQSTFSITPHYEVISTEGPDHAKIFTVQAMVGEMPWGVGQGRSKQAAAQVAARRAMERTERFEAGEEEE